MSGHAGPDPTSGIAFAGLVYTVIEHTQRLEFVPHLLFKCLVLAVLCLAVTIEVGMSFQLTKTDVEPGWLRFVAGWQITSTKNFGSRVQPVWYVRHTSGRMIMRKQMPEVGEIYNI